MNRCIRIFSLMLALVLLSTLFASLAFADAGYAMWTWDPTAQAYLYTESHNGIVLCTRMTVRDRASTAGKSLGTIRNGQPVKIMGITQVNNPANAFYLVDLASCGIKNATPGSYGYVKTSLIKMDPFFVATTKTTNLYATPWSTDLKNGEQGNRFFLVIGESANWYAVQTADGSAGTSFIRTGDIGWYSTGSTNYVITWDTPVYDETTWAQIQTVKRLSVGSLVTMNSDHYLLVFNQGKANEFRGWVPSLYIAPLVN